jgi:transcription initiation factor TFIIIB Brf1 subunit/transcription initiation factor TFIIB
MDFDEFDIDDDKLIELLRSASKLDAVGPVITSDSKTSVAKCCDVEMKRDLGNKFICEVCGCEIENKIDFVDQYTHDYSNSRNTRKTFVSSRTEYKRLQRKNIMNFYEMCNQSSFDLKLEQVIMNTACDYCQRVQGFDTYRGSVLKRIYAACLRFACNEHHIARTNAEIAIFCGLTRRGFSLGERIVCELNEEHDIKIPKTNNNMKLFLERYRLTLGMTRAQEKFAAEIIKTAKRNNIGVGSTMPSRCAGAIWIVIQKLGLPITIKIVDNKCKIRANTFKKYSDLITHNEGKFAELFAKYKVVTAPSIAPATSLAT